MTLGTGETLGYDRLILATGSDSFVPPTGVRGSRAHSCCAARRTPSRVRDFAQEHAASSRGRRGGRALGSRGGALAAQDRPEGDRARARADLLSRQLDQRAAELLREYLEGWACTSCSAAETASLRQRGRAVAARGDARRRAQLPADVFIVAAGISPLVELARDAGAGDRAQGIVVDDTLRNERPRRVRRRRRGRASRADLRSVARRGGAGRGRRQNASAASATYEGTVPVTMLKVVGVDLLSIGRFQAAGRRHRDRDRGTEEHSYRKLVIERRPHRRRDSGRPPAGGPACHRRGQERSRRVGPAARARARGVGGAGGGAGGRVGRGWRQVVEQRTVLGLPRPMSSHWRRPPSAADVV